MITTNASCYFEIEIAGDAAGRTILEISPRCVLDIETITLLSESFTDDISCSNAMSAQIGKLTLDTPNSIQTAELNPLYIPNADVETAFADSTDRQVKFTGVDGNPFTVKTTKVETAYGDKIIEAHVRYESFILPPYQEIMQNTPCVLH